MRTNYNSYLSDNERIANWTKKAYVFTQLLFVFVRNFRGLLCNVLGKGVPLEHPYPTLDYDRIDFATRDFGIIRPL